MWGAHGHQQEYNTAVNTLLPFFLFFLCETFSNLTLILIFEKWCGKRRQCINLREKGIGGGESNISEIHKFLFKNLFFLGFFSTGGIHSSRMCFLSSQISE